MATTPALLSAPKIDSGDGYSALKRAQKQADQTLQKAQGGISSFAGGGYTGARVDRASMARWFTTAGSANADQVTDLAVLRSRARDQVRNAPIATGAVNMAVSQAVGTGLSLTPQIDAALLGLTPEEASAWQDFTRLRFNRWAASLDCDLGRRLNFWQLQDLVLRSTLESGDTLLLTPKPLRAGASRAVLALQQIEADRVLNRDRKADSATTVAGVNLDPVTGEAVSFDIADRHPGDALGGVDMTWTTVAARGSRSQRRNVLHIMKPIRPGQVRGVPWIAPILEPLKQLSNYTDAELNAAVASALLPMFATMDPKAFNDIFEADEVGQAAKGEYLGKMTDWSGELESGRVTNLLPGESVTTPNTGRPNTAFNGFVEAILVQIGQALEIPYQVLTSKYDSSYSAARASLLQAWKFFRVRRDWLATVMCQPVYELWLADEIADGLITAPGFFADPDVRAAWCGAAWVGDAPGSIDPQKEVQAASDRVALGISTIQAESIAFDAVDWESKHPQTVRETQARRAADLPIAGETAAAAPKTEPAQPGNP